MGHFSEQVFVDFARGVDTTCRTELESHLAGKCQQCTLAIGVWKRMREIAGREITYSPPDHAVRMVKLGFEAKRTPERDKTASLVFDSFLHPALAGVRGAAAAARQMVYEAEGLTVDLRFDRVPRTNSISLIGQVLTQKAPRVSLANAVVMLWTEKGLVMGETRTNGLGEFQLEFEAQNGLGLSIQAVSGTLIRIPLANLNSNQEANGITHGTDAGYR